MSKQETPKFGRRDMLNIGAISFLGLAFPIGMREEFSIVSEHDGKPKQAYPLTDTIIKTRSGNEIRIIGVLHTARGLRRSQGHLEEAVKNSDLVLTENTELVGVKLEYFNDLAKFANQEGKVVIDIDRFNKTFKDWITYCYVGSTFSNLGCVVLASHGQNKDKPKLKKIAEIFQTLFLGTAIGSLLMTKFSPVRNYGPKELDISFEATARSIAMYCNAQDIADQSKGKRVTVFCGEGHARDMIEFHARNDDKSNSALLKFYSPFLEKSKKFSSQ